MGKNKLKQEEEEKENKKRKRKGDGGGGAKEVEEQARKWGEGVRRHGKAKRENWRKRKRFRR